jgi:hypothetical protein
MANWHDVTHRGLGDVGDVVGNGSIHMLTRQKMFHNKQPNTMLELLQWCRMDELHQTREQDLHRTTDSGS